MEGGAVVEGGARKGGLWKVERLWKQFEERRVVEGGASAGRPPSGRGADNHVNETWWSDHHVRRGRGRGENDVGGVDVIEDGFVY